MEVGQDKRVTPRFHAPPDGARPRGHALPGDEFTLSPGANGAAVTGGASWRMVVDLGDLKRSVGTYPGGQSEDPSSPHYEGQVKPWAKGNYLPLYFYSTPEEFGAGEVESVLELEPKTR